jgi:PAS domain S-box-containing protein
LKDKHENLKHSDDLPESDALRRLFQKGEIKYFAIDKCYIHKDGHFIWASVVQSVIPNDTGDIIHYVSIIKEITQRKTVELVLQQAKDDAEVANWTKS